MTPIGSTDPTPQWEVTADVVVVGSGVAGLTCAADLTECGLAVLIVTKGEIDDTNTRYAQGGIAVVDEATGDRVAAHAHDTEIAGAGLCDRAAVREILRAGPAAVRRLQGRGAGFDTTRYGLIRSREGGHHTNRIIHAGGDATGAEVQRALSADPSLPAVGTDLFAVDVALTDDGVAAGLYVLDEHGALGLIRSAAVVLATGGAGQLYAASTNPAVATGDGIAMALRAGAIVADLEFVQFHPTALWTGPAVGRRDLVTEAIRGAGATLVDGAGRSVMAGVHPLADLAPRDVVALAITRRLLDRPGGIADHVFLDCASIADVENRFPTVAAACAAAGFRLSTDPIPVSPAAHYLCGGVQTDHAGRTAVPGLYAAGEVARTGLHGANRLASNSLLEGLVMGGRVARTIAAQPAAGPGTARLRPVTDTWYTANGRADLQAAMSRYAGIGRSAAGLAAVSDTVDRIRCSTAELSRDAVEATNLAQVSDALIAAAARRTESRGCHVRTDRPETAARWAHSQYIAWDAGRPVLSDAVERRRPVLAS